MHRLALMMIVPLSLAGCVASATPEGTSPDVARAPLVCDAARADEVVFVHHVSAGFFAPFAPHGQWVLVVDGSCRYVVNGHRYDDAGELRTGTLSADELARLNDEVLTADWAAIDGVALEGCCDASTVTLRRGAVEASCYEMECEDDPALAELSRAALSFLAPLWERGEPLDGPVDVVVQRSETAVGAPVVWDGDVSLAATLPEHGGPSWVEVTAPEDARRLRDLRLEPAVTTGAPHYLDEDGTILGVGVADRLPWPLELRDDRGGRPW